jgi:hypothetical protein
MAEIQQFNLGQLLGQAEAIKGARRQNQLAELMAPIQQQSAQLGLQQAQLGQTQQLARTAMSILGDTPEHNWPQAIEFARQRGADLTGLEQYSPQAFEAVKQLASGAGQGLVKHQMGAGATVDIGGTLYFSAPIMDPTTGSLRTELTPVGGGRPIIVDGDPSQYGATDGSRVVPAPSSAQIVSKTTGLTASGQIQQKQEESAAGERGKRGAGSRRVYMDEGLASSDAMFSVTRAMSLLKDVRTGGVQSTAGLRIRQMTGSESADEGELSGLLGKSVLSQLRSTFGAAFTEAEGRRLIEIEAGFGKNPETNMRLLQNAYSTMERAAERGIRAAEAEGDDFTAKEIRMNLDRAKEVIAEASDDASSMTAEQRQRLEALRSQQR